MTASEREAYARIGRRAAELMVTHPERSVDYCLYIAALEDVLLYEGTHPPLTTSLRQAAALSGIHPWGQES